MGILIFAALKQHPKYRNRGSSSRNRGRKRQEVIPWGEPDGKLAAGVSARPARFAGVMGAGAPRGSADKCRYDMPG